VHQNQVNIIQKLTDDYNALKKTVDGGEFRSPMAVAVIGGLIVSTGLSLIFVPAFFLVMDDVSRVFARVFARLRAPEEAAQVTPR
jgi:hypothetical protein